MSVDSYLEELEEKERQRKGKALHKIGTQHWPSYRFNQSGGY
jgi:hypothetical protein